MKRFIIFLLFAFFASLTYAQDLHYSQFYNSPLNINPANTGIFSGDKRINLSFRNQWQSLVPWTTFSASYDQKFYPKGDSNNFFSGGILFNYDKQSSVANLSLINIDLLGSYTWALNENNLFTGGLVLGFANRAIDTESLTWDTQWDGSAFNPTGPREFLDAQGVTILETGLGANYRWQRSKRTKLDLGIGVYHLIQPNIAIRDGDEIPLYRRFSLNGVGSFELAKAFDLQLQALGQFQGPNREFQFGGLGKMYVNQSRGKELEVHVGVGYRASAVTKSIFPILALQLKNTYISASYDFDDFDHQGARAGSLELHFRHIITNVKPFKKLKVCPIF